MMASKDTQSSMEHFANPHARPPASPWEAVRSLWRHRTLVVDMARREVIGRYRGSLLGLGWSLFNPLLMLVIYTFVFSEVFKARWDVPGATHSKTEFATVLFTGMVIVGFFNEVLTKAPSLLTANVNFVKKVVFPLEVLPASSVLAAMFHATISGFVLVLTLFVLNGAVPWTAFWAPVVLAPIAIFALGMAWFLASLGVYMRDMAQTVGILATVIMFLTPVFYPARAVPEPFRTLIELNPLTPAIESCRDVLIWGAAPDFHSLAVSAVTAVLMFAGGFAWFQRTKRGFADVL
jgi:lipopolysaccharide transport system permease protein